MQGWLVYETENVARNQRFIDFFMAAAKARGVALRLITVDQIVTGVTDGRAFVLPQQPDFAVMRCMAPLLSRQLERCGVRVFNSARVSEICNDKRRTHQFFAENGFPALPTAFVSLRAPGHPFGYPMVVKAAGGCGGRQVFRCDTEEEYRMRLAQIAPDGAVAQPLCDTPGRDVRAYVLGNRIVQAMERYSDSADFRSNFGLHGHARKTELTPEMADHVNQAARLLQFGLVGVDFVFHQGRPYLNEIEDAVGTRMLYQYTDLQIVDDYMDFILREL